jgi:3-hydroxyisobutyrate dehydrogenase-like beta-hydroxyacid dehydrogenase
VASLIGVLLGLVGIAPSGQVGRGCGLLGSLGGVGGRTVELVGEQHAAALRELSLRLYTAGSTIAAEQGLVLADKLNLSSKDVQAVLDQGAMASPMVALKGPLMAKHEYSTAFPLKYALKDMRFALSLEEAPELPVSAAAAALYAAADDEGGLGDADFCAVMEAARGAIGEKREC